MMEDTPGTAEMKQLLRRIDSTHADKIITDKQWHSQKAEIYRKFDLDLMADDEERNRSARGSPAAWGGRDSARRPGRGSRRRPGSGRREQQRGATVMTARRMRTRAS